MPHEEPFVSQRSKARPTTGACREDDRDRGRDHEFVPLLLGAASAGFEATCLSASAFKGALLSRNWHLTSVADVRPPPTSLPTKPPFRFRPS
jgi:hypothetical protein